MLRYTRTKMLKLARNSGEIVVMGWVWNPMVYTINITNGRIESLQMAVYSFNTN